MTKHSCKPGPLFSLFAQSFVIRFTTGRIRQARHEHPHACPRGSGYVIEPERIVRWCVRGAATANAAAAAAASVLRWAGAATVRRSTAAGHDGIVVLLDDASSTAASVRGTAAELRGRTNADIPAAAVRTTSSSCWTSVWSIVLWPRCGASSAGNGTTFVRCVRGTSSHSELLLIQYVDRRVCGYVRAFDLHV
jgi:hypothetical protein